MHPVMGGQRHAPPAPDGIGKYLGVTEIPDFRVGDDRVARVFGEVDIIGGIGDALLLVLPVGGVHQHHGGLSPGPKAGGVLPVHHRRAGEHGAQLVRVKGHGQVLPVEQVLADSVGPVLGALAGLGVVLGEQMVGPVHIGQAVGIVDPALLRCVVDLRAEIADALGAHKKNPFQKIFSM